ncbi:hypothetical protein ACFWP2_19505 [Kitasatospora sp. NPDC058444]|uniref:hypothetical protein n=1 Tax=Kitasatospora sp. NPDC058444 TaxID=3346504 RepID=UPI00364C49D6
MSAAGCTTKASSGAENAGRSPVGRSELGLKRSQWIQGMIDRREIVAGVAVTGLLQVLARRP